MQCVVERILIGNDTVIVRFHADFELPWWIRDGKPHGTGTRLQQQGTRGEVDIGRTWTTKATSLGVWKAPQRSNAVGNGCAIRDMIDPTSVRNGKNTFCGERLRCLLKHQQTRKTQRTRAGIKMRRGWVYDQLEALVAIYREARHNRILGTMTGGWVIGNTRPRHRALLGVVARIRALNRAVKLSCVLRGRW